MSENEKMETQRLEKSLEFNIHLIRKIFVNDDTLVVRPLQNKYLETARFCIFYIDGMVEDKAINESIIQPVLSNDLTQGINPEDLLKELQNKILFANEIELLADFNQMISTIISGDTLLLVDGFNQALALNSKGWKSRPIVEPTTETIIRGPREGFNESIMINLSLLRRKLQTPDLKYEFKELGERSHTKICICYLESLANPKIIQELYIRLDKIKMDGILDSGYIQEMIKDSPYVPFKTIGNTERPDIIAGKLLEGRIAIIVDGTPAVLSLPYVFVEYFQSSEDYYNNFFIASINRIVRVLGMIITVCAPAVYVALFNYHQELIPTNLLLSIAATREGIPLPTILEISVMLFVFEVLREAGYRMPSQMGQTISIVGALVLGQAAVEARLVSATVVIVVAITGISGILIPRMKGPNILARFIFLLLAGFLGVYGFAYGLIGYLLLLFGMRSFGMPYMNSIGSLKPQDLKDTAIRAPWWGMKLRTKMIPTDSLRMNQKSKGK